MNILEQEAKRLNTITFEVSYVPNDGGADGTFIALAAGDDWTGLSGFGSTVREAVIELLEEMEESAEEHLPVGSGKQ